MSKPDETGAPLTDAAAQRPRAASRPRGPRGRARPAAKGFSMAAILGFSTALITLVLDQVTKLYTLFVYDLPVKEPVEFAPFINLIVVWNRGISYGLFQQNSELGRWGSDRHLDPRRHRPVGLDPPHQWPSFWRSPSA